MSAGVPFGVGRRLYLGLAALLGGGGVAAAALASHAGSGPASSLALIALAHAPMLLFLSEWPANGRFEAVARGFLVTGVVGFCLDMGLRIAAGFGLGPLAPMFGVAMILGWLGFGCARAFGATRPRAP